MEIIIQQNQTVLQSLAENARGGGNGGGHDAGTYFADGSKHGQLVQHAAGEKSRAVGLVNECLRLPDTCRSRRAGAHRKVTLSKSVSGLAADARYGLSQQWLSRLSHTRKFSSWAPTHSPVSSVLRQAGSCYMRAESITLFCGRWCCVQQCTTAMACSCAWGRFCGDAGWTCSALYACSNDAGRFMWWCGLDKQCSNFARTCGTFGETCVASLNFPMWPLRVRIDLGKNAMVKEIYNRVEWRELLAPPYRRCRVFLFLAL